MIASFRTRVFVFACLLMTPFLSYLARNHYSVWRLEVLGAVALLAAMTLALAGLTRWRPVLAMVAGGCAGVDCAQLLGGSFSLSIALCVVAAWLLREKAVRVVGAVALAGYAAAWLSQGTAPEKEPSLPAPVAIAPQPHVLYLILDEHLGVGAFPHEIPACASAERAIRATYLEHRFVLHPNAYSNYGITIDSLPSALNRTLLPHSHKMVKEPDSGRRNYQLTANALCSSLARQGLAVTVCQHQSLDLAAGSAAKLLAYRDSLESLMDLEGGWLTKGRWLIASYQASDPALRRVNAFFPFRLHNQMAGPLALRGVWPGRVLEEIRSARKPTLFLVHLLMPHAPYMYRKDGSLRPLELWAGDRADRRLPLEVYREHYSRYCEQTEYLSRQLNAFFERLRSDGAFDAMSIVVHGDHGSRIRRLQQGAPSNGSAEYFDYGLEPPTLRDLQDRFSTLMAIKGPGQRVARVEPAPESLLRILERDFYHSREKLSANIDQVYLNDNRGLPKAIPILNYWKAEEGP